MEFEFKVCIYPLTIEESRRLREVLQALILAEVNCEGKFMGPVVVEEVEQEVFDGEANEH